MKILIVDDDRYILEDLTATVDWDGLGFEPPLTASSAREALNLFESQDIDILLTDIDMPGSTGLDLLRTLRKQGSEVTAIFLTNYAEFDYAREALKLDSLQYLLKPVDYEELQEILRDAIEIRRTKNREEGLLSDLLMYRNSSENAEIDTGVLDLYLLRNEYDKFLAYLQDFIKKIDERNGLDKVALVSLDVDVSKAVYDKLKNNGQDPAKIFCTQEYHSLARAAASSKSDFMAYTDYLIKAVRGALSDSSDANMPAAIKQYIDQNFTSPISRNILSEIFYLDPDYGSRIFKKEYGVTFSGYIQQKRLDLAKSMLEETSLPVSAISEQVGYDDYSYFTRVFRKTVGITPVEYRNRKD
ncbi:MAG: response regulator [Pseudobutyrivibrio sp.]|nr:response regulator [Pseudobutyrivibrio sp.]